MRPGREPIPFLGHGLLLTTSLLVLVTGCTHSYETARADRPLALPKDHVNHPRFKDEWWYWNGHLTTHDGRPIDFSITFARHNTTGDKFLGFPVLSLPPNKYFSFVAITDPGAGKYYSRTKLSSPDFWAAGADDDRLFVWHDSWSAQWVDDAFYVVVHAGERTLQLRLRPEKPAVLYGEQGFVDPVSSPHYVYSYSRLSVTGSFVEGGTSSLVKGIAWFDHVIGTLETHETLGWDYMTLQLDDGYDYFHDQIWKKGGGKVLYESFEVGPDGRVVKFPEGQVVLENRRIWESPESGHSYRLDWVVRAPGLELHLVPVVDDQEFRYKAISGFWEGAVQVTGIHQGRPVTGRGQLETITRKGLPTFGLRLGQ